MVPGVWLVARDVVAVIGGAGVGAGTLVDRDPGDHQGDAGQVLRRGDLAQHDRADDHGEHRQQGEHQRERGPGQPGHGQLVRDVGDDRRAHPDPRGREQQHRMTEGPERAAQPEGGDHHGGDEHRGTQLVDRGHGGFPGRPAAGYPVAQDHVPHEQDTVAERAGEAERLAGQADIGDRGHPRGGEGEGQDVAPAAGGRRREQHGAEELDGAHGGQGQPGQRQVEQRVHGGEHHAELDENALSGAVEPGHEPPRAAPEGEHHGGGDDAQPRHPQDRDAEEQQHRERRPQVVKHRADQEER